ncbi:hypothetical protein [Flammeovirga sp. SJP92]|uniref:hypothetical protein n=1 Tax=Flammeovirga sp. SJP92 TaxID=1775430 RepID=UPI000787EBFC|nr:hypothetical protein [Flammeovirga sp. SJP92]KXX70507.1 hypothetical protein AVL50_08400 [Flammeovirga sp. SJP92]
MLHFKINKITGFLFFALLHFNIFAQSIQQQKWTNTSCGTLSFFEDSLLLHIQENSFNLNEFNTDEVDITVKLYANYYDMLSDDIQMKDQNGIYISGGMYDIQVTAKGKKVNYQKEIKVSYISDGTDHFNGYQFDAIKKRWNNLNSPVLDYASTNTTSDDWGALQPRATNFEGFIEGEDDWGDEWSEGYAESQWLYKTMNIKGNGLFNYDYLIGQSELITYQVKVTNKELKKIYVYYPHLNTVIYYYINSDNIVEDFALVDTDLSNIRIFTFDPLKEKDKVKIGEINKSQLLKLSKEKLNTIEFEVSEHPLSKATLDQKFASI